jgi:hypothetical protein
LGLITKANLNHCVLLWKRDDGWCLKSVHPKSNILSSQRFRNYMDTTTFSSQNSNIALFCSHKYYLYHVDTFHWLHSASLYSCKFYSSFCSWCWQTLLHRNILLMLHQAQQMYSIESLHF